MPEVNRSPLPPFFFFFCKLNEEKQKEERRKKEKRRGEERKSHELGHNRNGGEQARAERGKENRRNLLSPPPQIKGKDRRKEVANESERQEVKVAKWVGLIPSGEGLNRTKA